eukprot:403356959
MEANTDQSHTKNNSHSHSNGHNHTNDKCNDSHTTHNHNSAQNCCGGPATLIDKETLQQIRKLNELQLNLDKSQVQQELQNIQQKQQLTQLTDKNSGDSVQIDTSTCGSYHHSHVQRDNSSLEQNERGSDSQNRDGQKLVDSNQNAGNEEVKSGASSVTTTTSSSHVEESEEEQIQRVRGSMQTKEGCLELLFKLFEDRIKQFNILMKIVDDYKSSLNEHLFTQECKLITRKFMNISSHIREIEGKMREEYNESKIASKVREIQELERDHLQQRTEINQKTVNLSRLMYELNKQKFIMKTIEDYEIDLQVQPKISEINQLKLKEGEILRDINDLVQELRIIAYYQEDDY